MYSSSNYADSFFTDTYMDLKTCLNTAVACGFHRFQIFLHVAL